MKIAIIGTRGIPNQYGGFEQLTEYLSVLLSDFGHEVIVYNSSLHPYKEKYFQNVKIISCFDPEDKLGTIGQFIYDYNCIIHARKQNYDIVLQLGYTSSSIWSFLFPKKAKIITNMDGLEWKRSKYGLLTKLFLKKAENWAVKYSDVLISDSKGIQNYLEKKYKKSSVFIPYGASIYEENDNNILSKYNLQTHSYYLVIARLEPENNIETIIKGFLMSKTDAPLIIIGSTKNKFGSYLTAKYSTNSIRFLGAIYNIHELNQLRHNCKIYFHGHSVGGTNPSLLEAMASSAYICAHNNEFNSYVLNNDALYFDDEHHIFKIITQAVDNNHRTNATTNNISKITSTYTWRAIADSYNKVFTELCR